MRLHPSTLALVAFALFASTLGACASASKTDKPGQVQAAQLSKSPEKNCSVVANDVKKTTTGDCGDEVAEKPASPPASPEATAAPRPAPSETPSTGLGDCSIIVRNGTRTVTGDCDDAEVSNDQDGTDEADAAGTSGDGNCSVVVINGVRTVRGDCAR